MPRPIDSPVVAVILLVLVPLLALIAAPIPAHAQTDPDLFTPAEVCAQVVDVFPSLDDEERELDARIAQLQKSLTETYQFAQTIKEHINPNASTMDNNYANAMFWVAMLKIQSINGEIAMLKIRREQVGIDRDIFTEIATAFTCDELAEEEEEEEKESVPALPSARSACNVTTGSIIPYDRLGEQTFIAVEDPNPTQEEIRWIEFRVATTYDATRNNATVWLDRIVAWSEEKQAEGWTELVRGGSGAFCAAIAANCITPPSGISPVAYETICGGD